MKESLLKLMHAAGLFAAFRRAHRGRALILTYHRFTEEDDGVNTTRAAFAEHLDYLTKHYRVVPLEEIARQVAGGRLSDSLAAITIDDGFRDAYEIAFPLLQKYSAPATVFVVTDFLDRKGWLWTDKMRFLTRETKAREMTMAACGGSLHLTLTDAASRRASAARANAILKTLPDAEKNRVINCVASSLGVALPEVPPAEFGALSWDQAREMDRAGVQIASHTVTHPILTNTDDEQLQRELVESKRRLEEELSREARLFCYPNGNQDARVRRAVAAAGYSAAVSTRFSLCEAGDDLFALPRINAERDLAHFAQSTSGFELFKRRLRGESSVQKESSDQSGREEAVAPMGKLDALNSETTNPQSAIRIPQSNL